MRKRAAFNTRSPRDSTLSSNLVASEGVPCTVWSLGAQCLRAVAHSERMKSSTAVHLDAATEAKNSPQSNLSDILWCDCVHLCFSVLGMQGCCHVVLVCRSAIKLNTVSVSSILPIRQAPKAEIYLLTSLYVLLLCLVVLNVSFFWCQGI
jgi:hypothetical protein